MHLILAAADIIKQWDNNGGGVITSHERMAADDRSGRAVGFAHE